jgi:hypothetical protein
MDRFFVIAILATLPVVLLDRAAAADSGRVDFNSQIRPILSDRCYTCHGPNSESRQADLRLDREEAAKKYAVVPGKPDQSELYLRISSPDDDVRMPPADSKLRLTDDEVTRIRKWIRQGAHWNDHWSYVPPGNVPVPPVQNRSWPRNEIDHFILARLEREGLTPAPEASRQRLIRRLSFDLTGLPPTLTEIDRALGDESPEAYEKLVDRLLQSPRYGERMAANWLDAARYSDTYGYQVDRDRSVWAWRDWVIRAFNDNMSYNDFITQQIAGDLLPGATDEQILATTFNRLHPQKVEGGSVPEEFRVEYVADRTQTFATAVLGLTMECARCHDHKYDPITQKEYYELFAFFNNIDEAGLYSYFTNSVPTPTLLLADDSTKQEVAAVDRRVKEAETRLAETAKRCRNAFDTWLTGSRASQSDTDELESWPGRIAKLDFEEHKDGPNKSVPGKIGKGVKLTGDDGIGLKVGNFRRFEPFSVTLWMNTPDEKQRAVIFHRSRAWTDAASRGYQLLIEDGCLSASLIHFWPGNAIRVRARRKIPTNQWLHVAVTYDGSSRADGLRIFVNGAPAACNVVRDNLYKKITGGGGDNITIGERFRDRGFTHGLIDEFQVFDRELTGIEVSQLCDSESLSVALETQADALSEAQREMLLEYYLAVKSPEYRAHLDELRKVRQQRSELGDGLDEIMVMREMPKARPAFLLRRGMYNARAERVYPDTPASLPPFSQDLPRNRLGLARWVTDPNHPLTVRVAVNRLWQMCFGHGLVRTPEDWGSQGEPPTHPELLDWLARDFIEHQWDVKRLVKKIVTSATYRQSSFAPRELLARDPENLLLARAPSYRLSAEMLRDNALATSGLLIQRIGGPPARPYDLEVSFKPVNRDKGDGLYRRSLYTYWKRTGPAPVMMALDASKRDVCRVRRERTSSPLQALVFLNGPQFVEAARALAQRLIKQHGDNLEAVIQDMFRTLTSREPKQAERDVLARLYARQLEYFEEHAGQAETYLQTGDAPHDATIPAPQLAATAVVANSLFGLDECVMKR